MEQQPDNNMNGESPQKDSEQSKVAVQEKAKGRIISVQGPVVEVKFDNSILNPLIVNASSQEYTVYAFTLSHDQREFSLSLLLL